MAQSENTQKVRRFPKPAEDETVAIPILEEAPAIAPANDAAPKAVTPAKTRSRRPMIFAGIGLIALLAGGYYGYEWFTTGRFIVATDDAYVGGDIATISSKLPGYVATVNVVANQTVKKGDALVTLDDGDYKIARDQAQAAIDTSNLTLARIDAQIVGAQASLAQANAQKQAQLAGQKNAQLAQTNQNLTDIKGQLLQQEKMAAIGTLSAGLLHEINNPVNFCLMAIAVAQEDPTAKGSPMLLECLTDAKEGMQRVQHIVSDLKTFAYRSPEKGEADAPFLVEKAIDSAIRLTSHELRGVTLERKLPPDTLVRGDEAAIIGVLINLLSNAALAMQKVQRENPRIEIAGEWIDNRLHVVVTDNGPGISEKNLSRVFEPFFTTRDVGKGLGLGLSISYSVIQRHGGTLAVTSQEGEWARFTFDLPRSE